LARNLLYTGRSSTENKNTNQGGNHEKRNAFKQFSHKRLGRTGFGPERTKSIRYFHVGRRGIDSDFSGFGHYLINDF